MKRIPIGCPFLLVLVLSLSAFAQNLQWKPIDPAHVALQAPTIEKDADAEALFWEVYLRDEVDGDLRTVLYHYIRLKVFNERGAEKHGKVDLIYTNRGNIKDIAGRTIKADGSVIELKKDAIFDREIIKLSGIRVKAKSFALPAVTPGSIIEYRWVETRPLSGYTRLQFQRDFPVQSVKYFIKPSSALGSVGYGMRSMTFHANPTPFNKEADGYVSTSMKNVPAFHEEPRMPPEDQVRPWMLLYYSDKMKLVPQEFWKSYGKQQYEAHKGLMKVNDDVRRAAIEAIGDATAPEQKLERLLQYCRTKIKNTTDDTTVMTDEERKKLKDNNNPADTLKRGYGNGRDIDLLFAAMAVAAGFEARVINLPDRSDIFFETNFADDYFLNVFDIAVKVGEEWKFFDPSSNYVPFGSLRWQQEGQDALLTDGKEPAFIKTPITPAEKTKVARTAKLQLTEDGTLEGEVQIEYTGHFAVERKEEYDEESPAEREKRVVAALTSRINNALYRDVKLENVTDPVKPLVQTYKVRVPGYAERTGKRLFLQPAFFQKGIAAMFPNSTREHAIYFHYPWTEQDVVSIDLPAGFTLDNAEAPGSMDFGTAGKYEVDLGITKDKKTLIYKRNFTFKGLIFQKDVYPNLKRAFDLVHQQDNHTVTLKLGADAAAVGKQ